MLRKYILLCIGFTFLSFEVKGQSVVKANVNWSVKSPFEHNVFIENKGQFTKEEKAAVGETILFYSKKGKAHIYFTRHSLVFRYDSIYREQDKEDDDKQKSTKEDDDDENIRVKHLYVKMNWPNANTNVELEAETQVSDYFTYNNPEDKTGHSGITANAWKKLIYHNLYPGIDMELFYPEEKGGIEYDFIVHPGADPSEIKMRYDRNTRLELIKNDLSVFSVIGNFITPVPISKDESGNPISTQFSIQKNTVSYNIREYAQSKPFTILNWQTSTALVDSNRAYDIDCDIYGNVYIYGGQDPDQLQKCSNTGALLWTYTTGFSGGPGAAEFCGDFTVDARNGTAYICDGLDLSGCEIAKVNTLGIMSILNAPTDSICEMWRIQFDYCNNQLVIGAGNECSLNQECTVDTNLNYMKLANILGITKNYHDIGLLALDQAGNSFLATTFMQTSDSLYNNTLVRVPLPTISPTLYKISDGYHFKEISSLVQIYGSTYPSNGFNGMAANKNMVFMYDGAVLKKRSAATGALKDSIPITNTSFQWGGLDIDCAENVYAGDRDSIIMFDSNLARIGFAKLPNTVYALKVGYTGQVYTCGAGFVCSFNALVPPPNSTATSTASASCVGCNGTATASLSCGVSPNYQWSNGGTTQTIKNLCPGTYTVTVGSCSPLADTAVVTIPGKTGIQTSYTDTNPQCTFSKGNIKVYPSNGIQPYTYLWSNGSTSQMDTGLVAGSYYCVLTDNTGCKDTISVTLNNPPPPNITVVSYHDTICTDCPDTIVVSGTSNYSWSPSTGLSCSNCPTPVATISTTTTYTVIGTDSLGCQSERIITILVEEDCENLTVPNVFTPNGDNINDYLEIKAQNTDSYSILIYDRWGKEVYKSTNPTQYWDGNTESGGEAPAGVYYYIIDGTCQGNTYQRQGFIQLIR